MLLFMFINSEIYVVYHCECLPKVHILQVRSLAFRVLGDCETFRRWDLVRGSWVTKSVILNGTWGPGPSSFSHCFPAAIR